MECIKTETISLSEDDELLSECERSTITEMIVHFSAPIKRRLDEERYVYSKRILNKFLSLNKNPQVQVREEYLDEDNTYPYYVIYRPLGKKEI